MHIEWQRLAPLHVRWRLMDNAMILNEGWTRTKWGARRQARIALGSEQWERF